MNNYYIRCKQSDWSELLTLGEKLGAVKVTDDGVFATNGGAWDFIGEIHKPTGNTLTDDDGNQYPEIAPVLDPDGNPYWHANLITPLALGELAISMQGDNPDIAAALAELGRFFLLDAEGNARLPTQPHRVWA